MPLIVYFLDQATQKYRSVAGPDITPPNFTPPGAGFGASFGASFGS